MGPQDPRPAAADCQQKLNHLINTLQSSLDNPTLNHMISTLQPSLYNPTLNHLINTLQSMINTQQSSLYNQMKP